MGLFVINGATAGGFSPISVFGSIVNGVVEREDLAENATLLFASSTSGALTVANTPDGTASGCSSGSCSGG
jgi:hypothetical protein